MSVSVLNENILNAKKQNREIERKFNCEINNSVSLIINNNRIPVSTMEISEIINNNHNDEDHNITLKDLNNFLKLKYRIKPSSYYIKQNNKIIENPQHIIRVNDEMTYYSVNFKLLGGKGGFGSLLKGQPAVKKRTKNFDSCRDLSGRRLRHVNQEKNIQDYLIKKKDEDSLLNEYLNPSSDKVGNIPQTKLIEINNNNEKFQTDEKDICDSVVKTMKMLKQKNKKSLENKSKQSNIKIGHDSIRIKREEEDSKFKNIGKHNKKDNCMHDNNSNIVGSYKGINNIDNINDLPLLEELLFADLI